MKRSEQLASMGDLLRIVIRLCMMHISWIASYRSFEWTQLDQRVPKSDYIIGQNFGRTKFFFCGQYFRHQVEISAVLSAEILSDKVFDNYVRMGDSLTNEYTIQQNKQKKNKKKIRQNYGKAGVLNFLKTENDRIE